MKTKNIAKPFIIVALALLIPAAAHAETYRLKYQATVEVLDDAGKVTGQRKLKPGTILALPPPVEAPAPEGAQLTPSKISPIVFKQTRPAEGAVLRAYLSLDDFWLEPFDRERHKYWNVRIDARNDDWYGGENFHAWLPKTSPIAKRAIKLLDDGKRHACLVKVRQYNGRADFIVELLDFMEVERAK